jgi:hypothetical protein
MWVSGDFFSLAGWVLWIGRKIRRTVDTVERFVDERGDRAALSYLPDAAKDGFDVVAIRIPGERSVVGGSIIGTGPGLAIVSPPRVKRSAMELSDLLLAVSLECKVNLSGPIGDAKVERR